MATHSSILAWRIPMDRGAWRAALYGVTKSQTRLKRLSTQACNKGSALLNFSYRVISMLRNTDMTGVLIGSQWA